VGADRYEEWTRKKTLFVGSGIAFLAIIVYGVIMHPELARADRTPTQLNNSEAYFFYEDQIGRPVAMSCYNKHYNSYFIGVGSGEPYFIALYKPFGQVDDFWESGESGDTILN